MVAGKIHYFIGNQSPHILHALPIYRRFGGEAIVLSEQSRRFCEAQGVKALMTDDYPEGYLKLDPRRIEGTLAHLRSRRGVLLLFDTFSFLPAITNLTKFMLFHGNSLKDWFDDWHIEMINACDFVTALSPFRKERMLRRGVDPAKLLDIGLTRWDEIVAGRGTVTRQERLFAKLGCTPRKVVAYLPTWHGMTSVCATGKEIVRHISDDYVLVFRPHPATPAPFIEEYLEIIAEKPNVLYVPENRYADLTLTDLYAASDMFIGDMSSTIIDAMLTDKPIAFALDPGYPPTRSVMKRLKRLVKALVYYGKSPFQVYQHVFDPVRELFAASEKIQLSNAPSINEVVSRSLSGGAPVAALRAVQERMFFSREGDATERLARIIMRCTKDAR